MFSCSCMFSKNVMNVAVYSESLEASTVFTVLPVEKRRWLKRRPIPGVHHSRSALSGLRDDFHAQAAQGPLAPSAMILIPSWERGRKDFMRAEKNRKKALTS